MTQTVERVYSRFQRLSNSIDVKDNKSPLENWQVQALHDIAMEAEKVLDGCRRSSERRS